MSQITATTLGSFCRELTLNLEPLEDLLASWELTPDAYEVLRRSEFFQNEMRAAVEEVRAMGPDAGFITRCKLLAEDALPQMVGLMTNATTPPEVKVKLFDTFTDLARLKPQKQVAQEGSRGPAVVFNFGAGIKGIPSTIEVTPEPRLLEG